MIILATTTTVPVTTPQVEAAVQAVRPVGVTVFLTGSDGSTWDLTHGPVRLQPGVGGLAPADIEHLFVGAPSVHGGVYAGYRVPTRTLRLSVFMSAGTSLGLRDLDASLWRALMPDADCTVTVVSPDGIARAMTCRFVGVGDAETPRDPLKMLYAQYQLTFVAGDPYWRGAAQESTFTPSAVLPFYLTSGGVLYLSPSSTLANAAVTNSGDVAAWPVYAVAGPVDSFSVAVGDNAIAYGPVAAGTTVWIDTDPTRQTVGFAEGDNDEVAWLGLTARKFAPVPAGGSVPIEATMVTPGAEASLVVRLAPRHRRPW